MSSARDSEKFHPRSPVQPDRGPAAYFVLAFLATILIWTATQYWTADLRWVPRLPFMSERPVEHPASYARGDVRAVFRADDYPTAAMEAGDQGTVQTELTIDSDGRVGRCTITQSSGHRSLDEATCSILQQRARFTPARDAESRPVASRVTTPPVSWRLEG